MLNLKQRIKLSLYGFDISMKIKKCSQIWGIKMHMQMKRKYWISELPPVYWYYCITFSPPYRFSRIQIIGQMRWEFGSVLPTEIKYNLSEAEASLTPIFWIITLIYTQMNTITPSSGNTWNYILLSNWPPTTYVLI